MSVIPLAEALQNDKDDKDVGMMNLMKIAVFVYHYI